ncbi:MAG: heme biosynthesis protein HemY, partial [Pararhodobacter sp.]
TRSGRLPKPVYQRRDAVLTLQQSEAEAAAGNTGAAQDLAIEANRLSPDLVPAAVRAAGALAARDSARAATKIIKRAWRTQPHPELAHAFAGIAPNEASTARLKRFEPLLALTPGPESQMTRAELLIAAEDFPGARRAMGDLHVSHPTQRVMTIMAAIERGEGSADQVVRGWLARALIAPRGPQWVCEKCHHEHAKWHAVCAGCAAFDTLSWSETADSSGPSATGTEMLPLIVGALPPAEAEAAAAASGMQNVSPVEEPAPDPVVEARVETPEEADKRQDEAHVIDLAQTRRMGL